MISDALVELVELTGPKQYASALLQRFLTGDVSAAKEVMDRIEGKLATPASVSGTTDPISITIGWKS